MVDGNNGLVRPAGNIGSVDGRTTMNENVERGASEVMDGSRGHIRWVERGAERIVVANDDGTY
jgi:hypothetical protein